MTRKTSAMFDRRLMRRAVGDAVLKLDPRRMARNPVMFVVG
jgi:high-affinity K+ transport system ATPase subunit B